LLGNANLINEEIDRYTKVTAQEMKHVANELFRNENSSTLYYLSKKK
jgi:hypothetical protein